MTELEPSEAKMLADAVAAIAARDRTAPLVTRLKSDWLSAPFRLCNRKRFGLLSLSSPAIHGDIAFVSLDFDCVLCGHGVDYALRRRADGWKIISENIRWVS